MNKPKPLTRDKLNGLSQEMYSVLYPNGKPNYNLSTKDFMRLLFVLDELSLSPLLKEDKPND